MPMAARPLFTENETNFRRLFGAPNASPYVKDAFHRYVVDGERACGEPQLKGTKAGVHYHSPFRRVEMSA